ncbi:unnamed protein product [Thlaspi arvense]|uniref:Uncharacterized protein n=1 Tax=Thlaspi arvense TaxID=13288 RepID=A0AAU9RZR5_THLAR|nr:unnamed protein product [Thlaspi arvense]
MDDHCFVVCGEWKMDGSRWNSIADSGRMSRVVELGKGMTILELNRAVLSEFYEDGFAGVSTSLSYWPPNSTELATGITIPPVLVTHK